MRYEVQVRVTYRGIYRNKSASYHKVVVEADSGDEAGHNAIKQFKQSGTYKLEEKWIRQVSTHGATPVFVPPQQQEEKRVRKNAAARTDDVQTTD